MDFPDFAVRPWIIENLYRGNFWSGGVRFTDVTDTNQKKLYMGNPSDSGQYYFIVGPTVRSTGGAKIDKWFNVSVDTAGATPTDAPVNKRSDVATTTDATFQTGGDNETGAFSGGNHFSPKQSGGGANPSSLAPGTVGGAEVSNILDPGDNMVIGVTNDSGTNTFDTSIDIDWIELPIEST